MEAPLVEEICVTFWCVIKERGRSERYKGVRPDGSLKTILCLLVYPWKLMLAFQALAILMWVADS